VLQPPTPIKTDSTRARPKLLDLFCGAGGATRGYQEAGFYVVGVDNRPQKHYIGDEFILADALTVDLIGFDAIHASPPCQAYCKLGSIWDKEYPDLIEPVRSVLRDSGLPYVIENIEQAPLIDPILLCGTMFPPLRVLRHRLFESNANLAAPDEHPQHPLCFTWDRRTKHYGKLDEATSFITVTGKSSTAANQRAAMGIPWMTRKECSEAIPPAYTKFIGEQLMEAIGA
jgi:DNA (cytosine-5)-methyltransferase 1